MIVGGFSTLVFGRTRMTMDIDIIIDHNQLDYDHFVNHFRERGFDINRSDLEVLDDKLLGWFFEKDTIFRIDLKGEYGKNEQDAINHALLVNFNDVEAYLDNPNHLIAHKLKLGSEQDLEDIFAVFYRSQELIDHELLTPFATNIGLKRRRWGMESGFIHSLMSWISWHRTTSRQISDAKNEGQNITKNYATI